MTPRSSSAQHTITTETGRHQPPAPPAARAGWGGATAARRARRVLAISGALVSAAILVAGCSSGTSAAPPPNPAGTPASSPAAAAPGATSTPAPAQLVAVQMTEFHLALPSTTLTASRYTFDAVNAGRVVHALAIDGPGVDDQRTGAVQPGASAPLSVTLVPGTYDLYCPVGNHKALGMNLTLTVTGPGAGPAPASPTGATGGS